MKNAINRTIMLKDILSQCDVTAAFGSGGGEITGVEYDSRKVKQGCLFVAVEGYQTDGHDYVTAAIANGACVIVISADRLDEFSQLKAEDVTVLTSNNTRQALSRIAALYYGNPSKKMRVIGITGTNGKTSITFMLENIYQANNFFPGVIGTVNYRWQSTVKPAPNTTPESKDLHEILALMQHDGVDTVIMEVSSHALELNRVDDIEFDAVVFTNLTRDHLDFHHDFDNYFAAKKIIFQLLEKSTKPNRYGIVNSDDPYGKQILANQNDYSYELVSFGKENGSYMPDRASIYNAVTGLRYTLAKPQPGAAIELHVAGTFHVYNSLAAIAVAHNLGLDFNQIQRGLAQLQTVPGRFDVAHSSLGFYVIVDYAHTSDALLKLLQSVNELEHSRIITVFGCGGDRDKTKRPEMGKIAEEYSDLVIVTSDNPRTEDPAQIIADIIAGMSPSAAKRSVIADREQAIKQAISRAHPGDIIVLAGKGHEDYQILGTRKIHFDDKETAATCIRQREQAEQSAQG